MGEIKNGLSIHYKEEDGVYSELIINNNHFGIQSLEKNVYETTVDKKNLNDFPTTALKKELVIKVCDSFEETGYAGNFEMFASYLGTPYEISKIDDETILITFEESGRRKFWDGEIGYKYYMEAQKQAIEERAKQIGDVAFESYDDDGDYIHLYFSSRLKTNNLSSAMDFSDNLLVQIEKATNQRLRNVFKSLDPHAEKALSPKEQEANLELMRLAIENGKKSISEEDKLSPLVGALLLKDGKVLGVAYRGQKGDGDHAEYTLFEKILKGQDISGATLYTTLEPCTHRNNHKPCSDWIIEKNIGHVYIGILDPNPKIYNNGCKKLKAAGVEVSYFPRELREEILNDNKEFIAQFNANPNLSGTVTFNYTNNNGLYIIGNNEMIFETKWSKASNTSIHAYNDPGTIKTISIADGNNEIDQIKDGSIYDSSSRTRTILINQILVIENINGYFAALKIMDIKDNTRGDGRDEVTLSFRILPNKKADFT